MSAAENSRQIVVFGLGEEEYAVAISEVQEIIRYVEPRSVASDEPWIRGVISLRGKIIPVCDLATRLGVAPGEGKPAKIIVVAAAEHTVGLIVDDVTEVLSVGEGDIESLRVPAADSGHSIAKVGERLIVLLASASVFDTADLADAI
jgi:purine-binding chemotaxis protein CheW